MDISSDKLKELLDTDAKILVEFYATWCGPCKVLKPIFEEVRDQFESEGRDVKLYTFDVDSDIQLSMSLGVKSIPVIKGFMGGEEKVSKIGIIHKNEIIKMASEWTQV